MDKKYKYFLTTGGYDQGFAFLGEPTKDVRQADIIVFTGGEDISPSLYNQKKNKHTSGINLERDKREIAIFNLFKDVPKLGVCRGHQLISVLEGAELIQHVNNHGVDHRMKTVDDREFLVTSCHHQMVYLGDLKDGDDYYEIGWASPARSTMYIGQNDVEIIKNGVPLKSKYFHENEMAFFPKSNSLTVQWHPEWMEGAPGQTYLKQMVDMLVSTRLEEYLIKVDLEKEYSYGIYQ